MARGSGDRLVYSSEHGRVCPMCGKTESRCRCRGRGARARQQARAAEQAGPSDGIVRVSRSTRGRKGKTVSLVTGVPVDDVSALESLASELKRKCGSGGALKDGVIEIQGDHRDTLVAELESRGFRVKRAGG